MTYDVIIPARNEEATVRDVVRVFKFHELISKVIVVRDDDTTDDTETAALSGGAVVVFGEKGKGQNVRRGLAYVETERVILCDADITGLERSHVDTLIRGLSPFVIGVPDFPLTEVLYSPKMNWQWMPKVFESFPWVSGIRVCVTRVLREIDLHGYLMEVQINAKHKTIGIEPDFRFLHGVYSPFKMTDKRIEEMQRDRKWGQERGLFG